MYVIENAAADTENEIRLKLDYPGLVTGVGITHEALISGEFKLGFHFDYTYGMPVIYGSTVKGVLRSYFREEYSGTLDVDEVIKDIFEGECNGVPKSIYDRDIFFDAIIVEASNTGHFLASDSITPHNKGELKNPIPLTFLKIAPGCTILFRFKLRDSLITAHDKKSIFTSILLKYGIGAKTNVGYGQFQGL